MKPKRYYKRLVRFPEGIDRLEAQVRLPVTGDQIELWIDDLFLGGGMKATVGYIILKYEAWEAAMDVARTDSKTGFRAAWALEWAYEQAEPNGLPEWLPDRVADDFVASSNGSLHRIYAKMLCDMVRFGGMCPSDAQAIGPAFWFMGLPASRPTSSPCWKRIASFNSQPPSKPQNAPRKADALLGARFVL